MSSYDLPVPRLTVISNTEKGYLHNEGSEPSVEVLTETVQPGQIFGGVMKRAVFGTTVFPARNDEPYEAVAAPGSGIVLPGGVHVYFLELEPGYTTPMHRTVSLDYLIIQNGCPVLITPAHSFEVENGKGNYKETVETVCQPGEVVVQQGAMHAWSNRSDKWVRLLCVVLDAETQKIASGSGKSTASLLESWLQ